MSDVKKEAEASKVAEETKSETTVEEPTTSSTTATTNDTAEPPSKPKRPLSPTSRAIKELQDAFPTIEEKYIKMALIASQGSLDPAFNALLYLSDPTSDITIPVPDVKPKLPSRESIEKRNQLESDEALARRLAREFEKGSKTGKRQAPPKPARKPIWNRDDEFNDTPYRESYGEDDDEPDFIDTVAKGVDEAKVKVSGWLGNIAKKINDTTQQAQTSGASNQLFSAFGSGNRNSSEEPTRRPYPSRPSYSGSANSSSGRRQNQRQNSYTSEDGKIQLDDNESKKRYSDLPPRPVTESTTTTAVNNTNTTSSKEEVPETKEDSSKKPEEPTDTKKDSSKVESTKTDSKWTALSSVDPQPVGDDTFLVDDSEDEDEDEDPKGKK